jgi:hypothetical protein
MPDRETFPKRAGPGSRRGPREGPSGTFQSSSQALGPRDANALSRSVRGRGQSHGRVVLARRKLPPNRSGRHVKLFPRVDERGRSAPRAPFSDSRGFGERARGVKAPGARADEVEDGNVSRDIAARVGPHQPSYTWRAGAAWAPTVNSCRVPAARRSAWSDRTGRTTFRTMGTGQHANRAGGRRAPSAAVRPSRSSWGSAARGVRRGEGPSRSRIAV